MKKIITFYITISFLFCNVLNAFDVKAKTAILQDFLSGKILYEKDADTKIYPASMTKIMTAIIAFDLLKKGEISLDDKYIVSNKAWRMSKSGYSSMFIMPNDEISVDDLLKGIIIVSGNDACIALAEGISGTEEEFAILMNAKAQELGMTNTNFSNSSGIDHINNYSTVRDVMIMSHYLIKNYPEFYTMFKETEYTWDRTGGDPITQGNRNPLLYKNIGADGIKTGFLAVEKYSLASSIFKNNRRLIAVGSGFKSKNERSKESSKMLIWGITNFDTIEINNKKNEFTEIDIWHGKNKSVKAYINEDIYVTVPRRKKKYIKALIEYNGPIKAPIQKDQKLAKLKIFMQDELLSEHDILALNDVKRVNIISRLIKSFNFLIWGDV
tara:strand:- start:517 stop:1665 length:1149 start_codon:yes stop_codon:yes gene_type:complete